VERQPVRLLGDDPIGAEQDEDQLGRRAYVLHVVESLKVLQIEAGSSVLALVGPWGSGKTSLLSMVTQELESCTQGARWLIGHFSPWLYSDLEGLQLGFFAELRDALPEDAQWSETRQRLGEYGRSLAAATKILGLVGLNVSEAAQGLADLIRGDRAVAFSDSETTNGDCGLR
jgi:predicted KAP-like P-loop ATPase